MAKPSYQQQTFWEISPAANRYFLEVSGFSEKDLIGALPKYFAPS